MSTTPITLESLQLAAIMGVFPGPPTCPPAVLACALRVFYSVDRHAVSMTIDGMTASLVYRGSVVAQLREQVPDATVCCTTGAGFYSPSETIISPLPLDLSITQEIRGHMRHIDALKSGEQEIEERTP